MTLCDLTKHSMTRSIARPLCDSWASCCFLSLSPRRIEVPHKVGPDDVAVSLRRASRSPQSGNAAPPSSNQIAHWRMGDRRWVRPAVRLSASRNRRSCWSEFSASANPLVHAQRRSASRSIRSTGRAYLRGPGSSDGPSDGERRRATRRAAGQQW